MRKQTSLALRRLAVLSLSVHGNVQAWRVRKLHRDLKREWNRTPRNERAGVMRSTEDQIRHYEQIIALRGKVGIQ